MKLGTEECIKALKEINASDEFEELAVELLLIPDDDEEALGNFTYKLCDHPDEEAIDKVQRKIIRIRKELEIEDE